MWLKDHSRFVTEFNKNCDQNYKKMIAGRDEGDDNSSFCWMPFEGIVAYYLMFNIYLYKT